MEANVDKRIFLYFCLVVVVTSAQSLAMTEEAELMDGSGFYWNNTPEVNSSESFVQVGDNQEWIVNETVGKLSSDLPQVTDSMQIVTEVNGFPEDGWKLSNKSTTSGNHIWGVAWELHIYTLAVLFLVMSLFSVIGVCRVCVTCGPKCHHFFMVHFLLFFLSTTRAASLLLNSSQGKFPLLVQVFLLNLGLPCLLSSFTLLFHALLHLAQTQTLPQRLQSPRALGIVISCQFATIVLADVIVRVMNVLTSAFASELVFVLWTWLASGTYLCVFRHLYSMARRKQGEMIRFTFTKLHIEGNRLPVKLPQLPLAMVMKVMLGVAVLLIVLSFLFIVDVVVSCGVLSQVSTYLWCVRLACRITELLTTVLMTYISMQPLQQDLPTKCVFSFICSKELWGCSCSDKRASIADDIYPTYCASNSAVARTHFTFEKWASSNTFNNQHVMVPPIVRKHFSQQQPEFPSGPSNTLLTTRSETISTGNKRHITMAALATLSDVHSHPPSMLFNENGFIRFREEGDQLITDASSSSGIANTRYKHNELSLASPGRNPFGTITLKRFGSSESSGFDVHLQRPPSTTKTEELCRRRSGGSTPSKDALSCGRPIPNLNLPCLSATTDKSPQDITPDSAVYMDLPNDETVDDIILCPSFELSCSHSLTDLPDGLTPKHNKRARSLLTRLRGSSFSLASHQGYEPLDSKIECNCHSDANRQWEMKTAFRESRASSRLSRTRPDSLYDSSDTSSNPGSYNVATFVDIEVQTDPMDFGVNNQFLVQNESKM